MVLQLLIQEQAAAKMPWAAIVISALIVVVGVVLLFYFFGRFKKSEKDAEEEWGTPGGLLLKPEPGKVDMHEQFLEDAKSTSPLSSDQVEPRPVLETKAPLPATLETAKPEPPVTAKEIKPPGAAPIAGAVPPVTRPQDLSGSPLGDDIWDDMTEKRPAPDSRSAARPLPADEATTSPLGTGKREPFEPPRIDPIVPNKQRLDRPAAAAPKAPEDDLPSAASAAERVRRSAALLEPPAQPSGQTDEPATSTKAPAQTMAAQVSASRKSPETPPTNGGGPGDEIIGTLLNYGKEPKERGGNGGTIFLAAVVIVLAVAILGYLFVPPVHSSVVALGARLRGEGPPGSDIPKVQVFPGTYDPMVIPVKVKGRVQNISGDTLNSLVVVISLQPHSDAAGTSMNVAVTPDEIAPNEEATFEFDLDPKQFKGYRVTSLRTAAGKDIAFALAPQASPQASP
jgi:hypothetical protein